MHIVLIETSGNQHYIFATNKLRENVGASELTFQSGTRIVLEVVKRPYDYANDKDGNELRKLLLAEKPIEDPANENDVEIIIATSGKAILLTKGEDKAKEIIAAVTERALIEMPGLTVQGAICRVAGGLLDIHKAIVDVHHRLEEIRYKLPSNQQRFLRLPFVAPCATSGLPAQVYEPDEKESVPRFSNVAMKKRENSEAGRMRLENLMRSFSRDFHLAANINQLERKFETTNWLAVIHADGNGLGQIFIKFADYLDVKPHDDGRYKTMADARKYLDTYRKFSIALDVCTTGAAGSALKNFQNAFQKNLKQKTGIDTIELPVVPLILGGDDLTVLCDGQYAIKFAYDFLTEFENQTAKDELVKTIAQKAFQKDYLGICAGIAIIKPHYPFHQAYELAEQLLRSAKKVKEKVTHKVERNGKELDEQMPCSAMDFYIQYDSAHSDLEQIRERLTVDDDSTHLFAKPYVVTSETKLNSATDESKEWFDKRKFRELEKRVCAMRAPNKEDANKTLLPTSKMNEIRQSLFRSEAVAKAEVRLIENRLSEEGKKKFKDLKIGDVIFFRDDSGENFTHFLDAIDAVDFWLGFDCQASETQAEEKSNKSEAMK